MHPRYLDRAGLTALWREGLLAQAVLAGDTKGYRHHPQLARFAAQPDPLGAIAAYLQAVRDEAARRGYSYDASRIRRPGTSPQLTVTTGQLAFERTHLDVKLARRAPHLRAHLPLDPGPHPLFRVVPGDVEPWERAA